MFKIDINGESFEYRVERRKRKTIGIKITQEGEVIVTSPLNIDDNYIRDVVIRKSHWILSKLQEIGSIETNSLNREFKTGESLLLLGEEHRIEVTYDVWEKGARMKLEKDVFKMYVNPKLEENDRISVLRALVEKWMRAKAREVFIDRTRYYSELLKLYPKNIIIKNQKSVWGSCSSKGNINYNFRLVMAPLEILDYIVVHELCHMKHPNHSREYWSFVESIITDYREKRNWLKENGRKLRI